MNFVYFYRNSRGPGIGHQPDGFDPNTRKAGTIETETPFGHRTFWGIVSYPFSLEPDLVCKFELWPDNPVQFAIWRAWEQVKELGSLWVMKDYASYLRDEQKLAKLSAGHQTRFAKYEKTIIARILLDAKIDLDELEAKLEGELDAN